MKEIGDMAPVRAALDRIDEQIRAAHAVRDQRIVEVLGELRATVATAIEDAVRPPDDDGLSPEEYAAKHGISRWAVYKKIKRGELVARRKNGRLLLPAA